MASHDETALLLWLPGSLDFDGLPTVLHLVKQIEILLTYDSSGNVA